jgi:hypothetical protein
VLLDQLYTPHVSFVLPFEVNSFGLKLLGEISFHVFVFCLFRNYRLWRSVEEGDDIIARDGCLTAKHLLMHLI